MVTNYSNVSKLDVPQGISAMKSCTVASILNVSGIAMSDHHTHLNERTHPSLFKYRNYY